MSKVRMVLAMGFMLMVVVVGIQQRRITTIKAERDRQISNNDVLQSELRQWQVDSTTMATDVKSLRFTVDEMERYRAEDMEKIEIMGVKVRNLEAVAKHKIVVDAPIAASIRDTLIIKDSKPMVSRIVQMSSPHISIHATIERDSLVGSIHLPVTLMQAVWIEYRRRWLLWRRPIAVHQTITSDNPYVGIGYSEYIQITK